MQQNLLGIVNQEVQKVLHNPKSQFLFCDLSFINLAVLGAAAATVQDVSPLTLEQQQP